MGVEPISLRCFGFADQPVTVPAPIHKFRGVPVQTFTATIQCRPRPVHLLLFSTHPVQED